MTRTTRSLSWRSLERLGRIRLSRHFFLRDFLHSEVASLYALLNVPDDVELAVYVGRQLCNELLEPLNATFGRIAIRSAFRSQEVNAVGNREHHNCASNSANLAHHIWDRRDAAGGAGATACIVIPWFSDRYQRGSDWRELAYWIHDHLPYSEAEFFHGEGLCCVGLSWHERPKKTITSWMAPRVLMRCAHDKGGFAGWYRDFPPLQTAIE